MPRHGIARSYNSSIFTFLRNLHAVPHSGYTNFSSVQFSSFTQSCPTLCDSMNHSTPGLPVHHHRPEFTQPMSIESVMPSNQSHPLSSPSLPPLIFPSIRVFSNESALQTSNLSNNLLKTSYSKSS